MCMCVCVSVDLECFQLKRKKLFLVSSDQRTQSSQKYQWCVTARGVLMHGFQQAEAQGSILAAGTF